MTATGGVSLLPINNRTNVTTLESLFLRSIPSITQLWYPNDPHFSNFSATLVLFVEHIILTVVVNGLARAGSYLQRSPHVETLKGLTMDPAYTGLTSSALEMFNLTTCQIEAYAYMLSDFPSCLAVALLLLYVLIVFIHTI